MRGETGDGRVLRKYCGGKTPSGVIVRTWGAACCAPTVMGLVLEQKNEAPAWDRGPREGAFRSQRRFHTGCVGSSILASLSEAGWE